MIQSYLNNYDVQFSEISSVTSLLSTYKETGNCQLKSFLYHERNTYVQILPSIRTNEVMEEYGLFLTVNFKAFSSFLQLIPSHSNSRKAEAFKGVVRYGTVIVTVECRCKIIIIP